MAEESFVISLSVLYRNAQKYFDHALQAYQIGWGQLIFLFYINENEGCTMQEVTRIGEVDKGTTTKSIQKLKELDYVEVRQDAKDKRIRRLYTTEKAQTMMNALYGLRNTFRHQVFKDMDGNRFEKEMEQACENSREILPQEESDEFEALLDKCLADKKDYLEIKYGYDADAIRERIEKNRYIFYD